MTITPPIKQGSALIAASVGMWALATLGVFVVIRIGHWSITPSDDRALTIAQIGAFYVAFFAAQLPAIAFVAFIVSRSTFRHPVFTAGVVTFICQMLRLAIHIAKGSWFRSLDVQWWVPVGFDLSGIIALALLVMVMAWILQRANKALHATAAEPGS